jgi:riboflavin-specific deaminase-like protein
VQSAIPSPPRRARGGVLEGGCGNGPVERPRVTLNCATSHDGRLAAPDGSRVKFSDDEDMRRVHRLRADCDAILVGIGTVLADDPHLIIKFDLAGIDAVEQPVRVVLDANARTPTEARVLDDAAPTLLVTAPRTLPVPGVHQVHVALTDGKLNLGEVLQALLSLGIQSVLVEGGTAVLESFLDANMWDAFTLYQAPGEIGGNGPKLWTTGGPEALELNVSSQVPQGAGTLWTFSPQ